MGIDTSVLANTTGVCSSLESDKSTFSPSCSPWVLYFPVSSIDSDQKNCMIDWCSTVAEYSWSISTPVRSINSHWNWTVINLRGKTSTLTITVVSTYLKTSSLSLATLVPSSIWITWLRCYSISNNVFQGIVRPSSIASLVSLGSATVNKLLLWKINWLTFE